MILLSDTALILTVSVLHISKQGLSEKSGRNHQWQHRSVLAITSECLCFCSVNTDCSVCMLCVQVGHPLAHL